jgi:hypothetical protein
VANADSIATWLPAAIRDIALGGRVALELLRDDGHATADLLRSGGAIGAVTADPRAVQGCTIRPLGDSVQLVETIRAGLGWGMVPDQQDRDQSLVELNPAWSEELRLYWQVWMLNSPGVEEVTHAVVRAARDLTPTT